MAVISKLTRKYQATIPKEIREIMGITQGDSVLFEPIDDVIILRRVEPADVEYLKAVGETMGEWLSEYDEEAYREL